MALLKEGGVPIGRFMIINKTDGLTQADLIIESNGQYKIMEKPTNCLVQYTSQKKSEPAYLNSLPTLAMDLRQSLVHAGVPLTRTDVVQVSQSEANRLRLPQPDHLAQLDDGAQGRLVPPPRPGRTGPVHSVHRPH